MTEDEALERAIEIRLFLIRDGAWSGLAQVVAAEVTLRRAAGTPRHVIELDGPDVARHLSIYRALETPQQRRDGPWMAAARKHAARPAEHRAERISAPIPNEEIPMPANATPDLPIDLNVESVALVLQVANLTDEDRANHYRSRSLADLHGLHQEAYAAHIFANRVSETASAIQRELGEELRKLADLADPQASEGAKVAETRKMPTIWQNAEQLKRDLETWPELHPEGGLILDADSDVLTPERLERGTYAPYRMAPSAVTILSRVGLV